PTVSAERAPPPGTLPDMLRLAPDWLDDGDLPLADVAAYADLAAATRTRGTPRPIALSDPALPEWESGLETLALPPALATRGLDPVWEATYGFTLLQVDQVLTVGQAPDYATILRGDFDPLAMRDAWVRGGYQAVETEGVTVWSLFPGDTIDLSAPASRPALGSLNNVVFLDEQTLVGAPKLSILSAVLRVVHDSAPSLAEQPEVAALLAPAAVVESYVTAMLLKGRFFLATPQDAATPIAAIPPVALALVGLLPPGHDTGSLLEGTPAAVATPGPNLSPRMVTLLTFADADAATSAVSLIQRRLAAGTSEVTGQPHTTRVQPVRVRVIDDEPTVLVEFGLRWGEADWRRILDERDLGAMMWAEPDPAGD
ncbi:MAG: hypothetical protein H0W06_03775, partial [Chloroflexia bacterium]|nr:hypothetical protein [Chloroflexia bacterium]